MYKDGQNPQTIGTAAISFIEALHSSSLSLSEIRKKKYDYMIKESLLNIDPLVLPPSPRATLYHGFRVYHQIKIWLLLMNTDCDLMKWGWEINNGLFSPIMTDAESGPLDLLEMIQFNCKESCDARSGPNRGCWGPR